ncbi:MAG: nuclear transport factor 2 family protein [Verrucomicrobiaceae bacterium]|nr:MAG: nuclear transport factor 2 family protein [Verrucomicrobiaceae bacterium]
MKPVVKQPLLVSAVLLAALSVAWAQPVAEPAKPAAAEEEIIRISKDKWIWMAEKKVEPLAELFDDKAVFVHMGGSMSKQQELDTIKGGGIHYKHAEIQETSVRFIGDTAILLSRLRLDAVVGGNEVSNPFTVTEVYVKKEGKWRLGSLSFTRMMR